MEVTHDHDHQEGTDLSKLGYWLGEILGAGTFANVRAATYCDTNGATTELACKMVNRKEHAFSYWVRFFHREVATITQLKHKHIIKVHSILSTSQHVLIFMPLAENGDLGSYIEKNYNGICNENRAKEWYYQLMKGMGYLQSKSIAHRDLKLQNILLTKNLNVKIADFGFATDSCKGPKSLSKTFCGTIVYAAPEVLLAKPYNPLRADMWSCGVVLYHMCTDTVPFEEEEDLLDMVEAQTQKKLHFNTDLKLSKEFKALVYNLLEPNTEWRYTVDKVLKSKWFMEDEYFKARHNIAPLPSQIESSVKFPQLPRYESPTCPGYVTVVTGKARKKHRVGKQPIGSKYASIMNGYSETEDVRKKIMNHYQKDLPPYPPKEMYARMLHRKVLLQKQNSKKLEESEEMKLKCQRLQPLTEEQRLFKMETIARIEKERAVKRAKKASQLKDDKIKAIPDVSKGKTDKIQALPDLSKAKDAKIKAIPDPSQAKDEKIQTTPNVSKTKDDKIQTSPGASETKEDTKSNTLLTPTEDDDYYGSDSDLKAYIPKTIGVIIGCHLGPCQKCRDKFELY